MTLLGHLYLHAPNPDNPNEYVTYRIAVEASDDVDAQINEEADDESA